MRSWRSRTQQLRIFCPENRRAVREATGGRGAREGTRVINRQGLQGGEAIADGVVSKTEIVHVARSRGDRGAERDRGSQASLGLLEALRPTAAGWSVHQPQPPAPSVLRK